MSYTATAIGGGYFRLYVNGAFFSRHRDEREAFERATKVLAGDPSLETVYFHGHPNAAYRVEVKPSDRTLAPPPSGEPLPMSDGGEDLVDFIDRIQGEPSTLEPLSGGTLSEQILEFAEQSKATWLVKRLYGDFEGDGTNNLVAIGWRGYVLILWTRQRGAIRIGS